MTSPIDPAELARLRHDLGGPLSVIMGYGSLLAVRSDERLRLEASKQISDAAEQLTARIDELFARLTPQAAHSGATSAATSTDITRVLVIDDDSHLRKLLHATFDGNEFAVATASDRAEIVTLPDPPPDVVILDWHLPSGSGADVLATFKEQRPSLPVIVLTGDARANATELGADAYLTKPFSPLELLETVQRLTR